MQSVPILVTMLISECPQFKFPTGSGLVCGGPLPLLFRRRALFLCGQTPPIRCPGGFGCPPGNRLGGKAFRYEVGKLGQCDFTIAQLGALLGSGHGDHAVDKASLKAREQHQPLSVRKRSRRGDVPREFYAAIGGIDVLTPRPGGTREPPTEFRGGNRERRQHLKIHGTSVAQPGRNGSIRIQS